MKIFDHKEFILDVIVYFPNVVEYNVLTLDNKSIKIN